jgi:hypothetical protein
MADPLLMPANEPSSSPPPPYLTCPVCGISVVWLWRCVGMLDDFGLYRAAIGLCCIENHFWSLRFEPVGPQLMLFERVLRDPDSFAYGGD